MLKNRVPIHPLRHVPVSAFTEQLFYALVVETCKRFESWARFSSGIIVWRKQIGTAEHQLNPGHGNTSNKGCKHKGFLAFLHKYKQALVPLLFTCLILFHKNDTIHPTQSFTARQIPRGEDFSQWFWLRVQVFPKHRNPCGGPGVGVLEASVFTLAVKNKEGRKQSQ